MILKISREIKTALLVLASIALFVWGYGFLKGNNIFDKSIRYYVEYDNVEGVTTSSNVTINGLVVGKVSKIQIQKETGKLLVELFMTNPIQISKNSTAYIYSSGFIGGKDIAIELDFKDTNYAESGDYLNSGVKLGMIDGLGDQLDPIQKKLQEVLDNANTMLVSINSILDEKTQADLKATMNDLSSTMASVNGLLATNKPKLDKTMNNLTVMSENFVQLSDSLANLEINKTFAKLDAATNNIDKLLAGVERGEGSIGKLMKDEQLYKNLENASKELEQLLHDVKENPKRYIHFSVFGKKGTPYVEPVEASTISN